jgi:hypothetical protein
MNVEPLGELTPHLRIDGWWISEAVSVGYFPNTPLRFVLEGFTGDPAPAEFVAAVRNFLALTVEDRAEAIPCVFKNYTDFVEDVGDDELDFVIDASAEVWAHVHPSEVHVLRRAYGDQKVYVTLGANCDWEEEHGLQIVYREGKQLNRVSAQDGHVTHADAYGLPEHEDRVC